MQMVLFNALAGAFEVPDPGFVSVALTKRG